MLLAALFLAPILLFLWPAVPARLRRWLQRRPVCIFAAPAVLSASFCAAAWHYGALRPALAALVVAYTIAPTICALVQGAPPGGVKRPSWLDMAIILLLWLPLELAAGEALVPRQAQGVLHAVAYGVAITLALWLFLGFRGLHGMKYKLPSRAHDLLYPLLGFAVVAPVLILLGLELRFLQPFHASPYSAGKLAVRFLVILAATALPEEILFRGLIQNWLMQRFGGGNAVLLVAGLIFGCAHLNNAPGPLPNWRYMILATIAGVVYGKVFQKSTSIISSCTLHAAVNTVKYALF